MLHCWAARAHAVLGDRHAFDRSVGHSQDAYHQSHPGDWPTWLYWMVEPTAMAEIGRGYALTGDHHHAIGLLQHGALVAHESPRDQILYLTYQAQAHLAAGDIDQAAHAGHDALRLVADDLDSARTFGHLTDLAESLSTHDTRTAHEFVDRYRTLSA